MRGGVGRAGAVGVELLEDVLHVARLHAALLVRGRVRSRVWGRVRVGVRGRRTCRNSCTSMATSMT
jgi:hypothetical protein